MNGDHQRFYLILAGLLTVILILATVDLILDAPELGFSLHVIVELILDVFLLITIVYLGRGWLLARRSVTNLRETVSHRQAERDAWRDRAQSLLAGLGEAIDSQMKEWNLTEVERETALMLLKGYSHKEIANLYDKSERTVRQHSVSIYKKSGLAGRAELSAFFLEDLLLPRHDEGEEQVSITQGA